MTEEMSTECLPAIQELQSLHRAARYLQLWSSLGYRPVAMANSVTEGRSHRVKQSSCTLAIRVSRVYNKARMGKDGKEQSRHTVTSMVTLSADRSTRPHISAPHIILK